jgi:hypothetical protein
VDKRVRELGAFYEIKIANRNFSMKLKTSASAKLVAYLERFAQQKSMVIKLNQLCELAKKRRRCGFEKWLQFELYLFFTFNEINTIKEVDVEETTTPDEQKSGKTHFRVDVVARLQSGQVLGIELKARINAKASIRALNQDLEKFLSTQSGGNKSSNFAIVFCAEHLDKNTKKKFMDDFSVELGGLCIIDIGKYHFFVAEAK